MWVDNRYMLPGLCQDFPYSRCGNGCVANGHQDNGQTWPSCSIQGKWPVCVFWGVFHVLCPALPSFWFLRSQQQSVWSVSARFCFLHPHWRAFGGADVAHWITQSPAPCLLSTALSQHSLAGRILAMAVGELNLIIVWLPPCGPNTDFTDATTLDNFVTERL